MAFSNSKQPFGPGSFLTNNPFSRGLVFGLMIIGALLAFEIFNYSTTQFALADLLGDASFIGLRWATILALAFCGIDFAGVARLFTPEEGADEPIEVWCLFGAWLLAALMNAMLTWWGVSIAILEHASLGNAVVEREALLKVVPVFVAILVWLSRVLIIGTFSVAGDRLFSQAAGKTRPYKIGAAVPANSTRSLTNSRNPQPTLERQGSNQRSFQSAPKADQPDPSYEEAFPQAMNEPTYHPLGMRSREGGPPSNRPQNFR